MIGTELTTFGQIINNDELMLVHIDLKQGKKVPAHDHPGQEVFFTPVRGEVIVTLSGEEAHRLAPGQVLQFAGEATVGVEAVVDSEFFVYLINRR